MRGRLDVIIFASIPVIVALLGATTYLHAMAHTR